MKTLQTIFEEERSREALISRNAIDRFMEERATGFSDGNFTPTSEALDYVRTHRLPFTLTSSAIGIAGVLATALVIGLLPFGEKELKPKKVPASAVTFLADSTIRETAPEPKKEGSDGESIEPTTADSTKSLPSFPLDTINIAINWKSVAENRAGSPIGIKRIELSAEELARIGIQVRENEVDYFYRKDGEDRSASVGGVFSPFGTTPPIKNPNVAQPPFHPRWVYALNPYLSHSFPSKEEIDKENILWDSVRQEEARGKRINHEELGRRLKEYIKTIDDESLRRIELGRLVPVYVKVDSAINTEGAHQGIREIFFWYELTPEFLAALPERVRLPLERELRLASILQNKPDTEPIEAFVERQPREIRQAFASANVGMSIAAVVGEAYTGALSTAAGAITSSSVFPNPTRATITVHYTLAAPRNVSLTLYDIHGKRMQTLTRQVKSNVGENTQSMELQEVSPGMYLVAIETEKGERAMQRVIVE